MNNLRKVNPFIPDLAVPPDQFAGREHEIKQIEGAILNTYRGRVEHILVQGMRGIGKTSIANYARELADMGQVTFEDEDFNFFTIACSLGNCRSIGDVCVRLLHSFKQAQSSLRNKVFKLLKSIKGLQVGPVGVQFEINTETEFLVPTFPNLFIQILDQAKDFYNGFFIILDETQEISELPGIASFIKTFLEELHREKHNNVMMLVTAGPEDVANFARDHPSFPRSFRFVDLPPMTLTETKELINKALSNGVPIKQMDPGVTQNIYHYSNGFPSVVHELGKGAFEIDNDNRIDMEDFKTAVLGEPGVFKGALDSIYDRLLGWGLPEHLLKDEFEAMLEFLASERSKVVSYHEVKRKLKLLGDQEITYLWSTFRKHGVIVEVRGARSGSDQYEIRVPPPMLSSWLKLKKGFARVREGKGT